MSIRCAGVGFTLFFAAEVEPILKKNEISIREGASGGLLVFSYNDRASWEELPGLIQRTVMQVEILLTGSRSI